MGSFGLIGLAGIGALLMWAAFPVSQAVRRRGRIRRRMAPIASLLRAEFPQPETTGVRERKAGGRSSLTGLDARYPLAGSLRAMSFACAGGLLTFVLLIPALGFVGVQAPLVFVVAAAGAVVLGWSVANGVENRKRIDFSDRFLIAMEDLHRMVRYGISSAQALKSITAVADEPLRTSLENINEETGLGVPLAAAMEREAQRVRCSELSMLAAVMATQARTGGNLSESVNNLAAMLRERHDNRSRIKAATAESRITLIILGLVPAAGIGLQALMQPDLVDVLLHEARYLLGIGVGLIVAGLVMSWMMIRSAQR